MKNTASDLLTLANGHPEEILLVLSYLNNSDLITMSRLSKRLNKVAHYSVYHSIYCRIEADLNFEPGCSIQQLLALVSTSSGEPRHPPMKQATMLQFSGKSDIGRLYNIVSTEYGRLFGDEVELWYASHVMLLVRTSGTVSFYDIFDEPLMVSSSICLKAFLNRPCLHIREEQAKLPNSCSQTYAAPLR